MRMLCVRLAAAWLAAAHAFIFPPSPARFGVCLSIPVPTQIGQRQYPRNFNSCALRSSQPTTTRRSSSNSQAASDSTAAVVSSNGNNNSSTLSSIDNNNASSLVDATALAESFPSDAANAGDYQINRPRWYNQNEAAVIVLLVYKLRLLDARSVEHMLEEVSAYRKINPLDVHKRAMFLMKIAPSANFRTVVSRHPRTFLVPRAQMKRVCKVVSDAFPTANMARVVERIPSMLSRNATRLEQNIMGIKEHVPEVDSAIFQAAPSMVFIPPKTIKRKAEALRSLLPGANLHTILKGMPTVLARSDDTVPRSLDKLRERFPSSTDKELVRLVEAAPGLMRMSGLNGTLDVKVDALMDLLPGVNVTNVFANAPGVLIRSLNSLPAKVNKLEMLFPTANVTKMVSRTPGILYLDVDRTIKPKALWIKGAVGLDQDGLDSLIETGPWLLKAGWGPLARLQFAVDAGIAGGAGDDKKVNPSILIGLVRRSRAAFAAAHHPAYANFLRKRLQDEENETEPMFVDADASHFASSSDERSASGRDVADESAKSRSAKSRSAKSKSAAKEAAKSKSGVRDSQYRTTLVGDEDEQRLMEETIKEVGKLEDRLGQVRKSRLGGVKTPPPKLGHLRRAPIGAIELEEMERKVGLKPPR